MNKEEEVKLLKLLASYDSMLDTDAKPGGASFNPMTVMRMSNDTFDQYSNTILGEWAPVEIKTTKHFNWEPEPSAVLEYYCVHYYVGSEIDTIQGYYRVTCPSCGYQVSTTQIPNGTWIFPRHMLCGSYEIQECGGSNLPIGTVRLRCHTCDKKVFGKLAYKCTSAEIEAHSDTDGNFCRGSNSNAHFWYKKNNL